MENIHRDCSGWLEGGFHILITSLMAPYHRNIRLQSAIVPKNFGQG